MRKQLNFAEAFIFGIIGFFLLGILVWAAQTVNGATIYPAGSLLQPGDVTSSHIRDNTIVNADINSAAGILISKLSDTGATGTIPYFNGTRMATSTSLTWGSSSSTLAITGGLLVTATTTINGVPYTWPSADGSANQVLSTSGSGSLSWGSPANAYIKTTYTTAETLSAGMPVSLGIGDKATSTQQTAANINGSADISTTHWEAGLFTSASIVESAFAISTYVRDVSGSSNCNVLTLALYTNNAGVPGTFMASSTANSLATSVNNNYECRANFSADVTITKSTKYWVVVIGTSADTGFKLTENSATTNPGQQTSNSGSSWTTLTDEGAYGVFYTITNLGQAYQASAQAANYRFNQFAGFALSAAATGTTATIVEYGYLPMFSGLSQGQTYYLGNATGTISTSAGTQSLIVGRALDTTTLMTRNP